MTKKKKLDPFDDYPSWCCEACALRAGGRVPDGHCFTVHYGVCCVCGEKAVVTQPRDYRYPKFKVGQYAKRKSKLRDVPEVGSVPGGDA